MAILNRATHWQFSIDERTARRQCLSGNLKWTSFNFEPISLSNVFTKSFSIYLITSSTCESMNHCPMLSRNSFNLSKEGDHFFLVFLLLYGSINNQLKATQALERPTFNVTHKFKFERAFPRIRSRRTKSPDISYGLPHLIHVVWSKTPNIRALSEFLWF